MTRTTFFPLALLVLPIFLQPLKAGEVLIDTEFGKPGEGEAPYFQKENDKFPLKDPSGVTANPPSSIVLKKEGIDGMPEPAAVFTIGLLPEGLKEAAAGARMSWHLGNSKVGMNGIYEVTYSLVPLKLPIRGGGRVQLSLVDPKGKRLSDVGGLPTMAFSENTYGMGGQNVKVKEGKALEVRIVLDLNKHIFDSWIDGKRMGQKLPLPLGLVNGYPEVFLGFVFFGSEAGLADKGGGSYGMNKMKVTWYKDSSELK